MKIITRVWTWIRIQIRDLRPQLRLCLRVTVAAMLSFVALLAGLGLAGVDPARGRS